MLTVRAIPGTLPAMGHARGLLLLARGEVPAAHQALQTASESWQALRRFWEGTWARLDLAETAARARRRGEATVLASEARALAAASGAAVLVAAGLTNRQIAEQLVLAPKTISAHVTHILSKLGAARRAEIGAWCATVRQDTSR